MRKLTILLCFFLLTLSIAAQKQRLVLQPNAAVGKDAVLHGLDGWRDKNLATNPQVSASRWTYNGTVATVRSVIDFDWMQLPKDVTLLKAELHLFAWGEEIGFGPHATLDGSNEAWVRRVVSPWEEDQVTWHTQPQTTTVNQVLIPASTAPNENYVINVTDLVKDMLSDSANSFGLLLELKTEEHYRLLNFCSSDHSDAERHPKLVLEYWVPNDHVTNSRSVQEYTPFQLNPVVSPDTCSTTVKEGSIYLEPSGGIPPYHYQFHSNVSTIDSSMTFINHSITFEGLERGTYSITVTDSHPVRPKRKVQHYSVPCLARLQPFIRSKR